MENRENFILIPLGNNFLALTQDEFVKATKLGKKILEGENPNKSEENSSNEVLLDADEMSDKTGIPPSWFLEAARQEKIPHVKAGKYVRFRFGEVIKTLEARNGHKARRNFSRK